MEPALSSLTTDIPVCIYLSNTIAPTPRAQSPKFPNQLEETLAVKKIQTPVILVGEEMKVDSPAPTVQQETNIETHQVSYTMKLNIPKSLVI